MDASRFDQLARAMGTPRTRRGFLGGLAGLAVGLVAVRDAATACPPDQVAGRNGCVCKATGRPPVNGSCGGCGAGQTVCGGGCKDLSSDLANCGACGSVCTAPAGGTALCRAGACNAVCSPGFVVCGAACVPAGGCCIVGVGVAANTSNPANACQACQPAVNPTAWSNVANGTSCNDGNACTRTDTCQGGVCVGGNPVVCTALDQCHDLGTCDPATGTCSNPNKPDGASCNDNNACTEGDTCQAGVCQPGAQKVCTTTNPCLTANCDPAHGCVTTAKAAGTACGDGNACDGDEVCDTSGDCVEGTPISCGPCTVCDPTSGQCRPADDGGACPGDGNKCYGNFVCQAGACTGINPVVCTAPDQCHFAGACDPATGLCANPDKPNGSFCTDNNHCTSGDFCQQGVCTGSPVNCDDGLACTDDICDPATGCTHVVRPGFCLIEGTCVAAGTPYPADLCQRCDPSQASDAWSPAPIGTACNDGNTCTEDDVCQADGTCAGTQMSCDDGLTCTDSSCDPDQGCVHVLQPTACLIEGACYAAGALNPEQVCQRCDPAEDQRRWTRRAEGDPCGDGACLGGATCVAGVCSGGAAAGDGCAIGGVCYPAGASPASNSCFVCDPTRNQIQWSLRANDTPCEGLCRTGGTCQFGICSGGTVEAGFCEIEGACIPAGETDPTRGQCWVCDPARHADGWTVKADDTPCANFCLANPTCQAGVCTGEPAVVCGQPSDRAFCQRAVCDPQTGGCVMQPTRNALGDTRGCEVCPFCFDGECHGTPEPVVCGPCGACDEATGTCVPQAVGADCGSDCNTSRTCNAAGACIAEPGSCGINVGCEAKICNPLLGRCSETGAKNGLPCGNSPCDVCQNGTCKAKQCGDCKRCDPATGQCVACETCCRGTCGHTVCGGVCCAPGTVCCNYMGFQICMPPDQSCEGTCYPDNPAQCCGRDWAGGILRCGPGKTCCRNDIVSGCCDEGEICGSLGCVSRA